uniref:Kinesin motor domain-containing protein n=1 Tax=Lotharella oceanica TaxID=641309 RepID=A0A7S2TJL2_9EUKA
MNLHSSRSHSVFTLYMTGRNQRQRLETSSALYLCDLAGSERIDKSGVEGARLKEAVNINKSLSALSDVFQALARGDSHVPFRNSKLTYLLQCCFVGNGKTLMFVNLSPNPNSTNESLCSLRFAQKVNTCVMGPASIQANKLTGSSNKGGSKSSKKKPELVRAKSHTGSKAAAPPPGVPRYARSKGGRSTRSRLPGSKMGKSYSRLSAMK